MHPKAADIVSPFSPSTSDCRSGKVKRERLDFLADNPHYTKRFAYYLGRRCRAATIKDVAADLKLDWHTVKTLDQQYMEAQLAISPRDFMLGLMRNSDLPLAERFAAAQAALPLVHPKLTSGHRTQNSQCSPNRRDARDEDLRD
jgi:hypothetical protein